MGEVIKGKFDADGIGIGERRAIALHEWLVARGGATPQEMLEEIERLKRAMPAPEDR